MIVHHRAGEKLSGLMSRQYRSTFNGGAALVAAGGTPLMGLLVWQPFLWIWPASVAGGAYLVNLVGRVNRIRPYELKKPDKVVEDEILELQDIYFHMPREHRKTVEGLLLAAYQQVERGNMPAVAFRLEAARKFRGSVLEYNAKSDDMSDIKSVVAAQQAMHRAIEA